MKKLISRRRMKRKWINYNKTLDRYGIFDFERIKLLELFLVKRSDKASFK